MVSPFSVQMTTKHWIFTFRVEPPAEVVSARCGGSVFFAAYSPALKQWFMVVPGGEEKIPEPTMIFVSEEWAREHPRSDVPTRQRVSLRKGKLVQSVMKL